MRTVGVRDYRPGDSPRRLHWKATARAPGQALQVKLFEPTTTHRRHHEREELLQDFGSVHLGLNIDPAAITDVDAFLTDIAAAYTDVAAYA